jgi:hypothetical protein
MVYFVQRKYSFYTFVSVDQWCRQLKLVFSYIYFSSIHVVPLFYVTTMMVGSI